ncbi:hypothetical protein BGZ76_010130 [Entomortierella beljakovae]|nr:hypothetical protein BGZ76_010130 [Entomortierella beljakovae]
MQSSDSSISAQHIGSTPSETSGHVQFQIREETPSDLDSIHRLTKAAFATEEYQAKEHIIIDKLREAGDLTLSLVAKSTSNGEIIGHVAFSPVTIENGLKNWYGLGPIAVSPNHQRSGIGSALIKEGLAKLVETNGASGCVVVGSPKYYGKFGFKSGTVQFQDVPEQYVMSLNLQSLDEIPKGQVTYRPAFYI